LGRRSGPWRATGLWHHPEVRQLDKPQQRVLVTDDDIIMLGEFCEQVLSAPEFTVLVQQYELQAFSQFASTAPEHKASREYIYATMQGMREFVSHMAEVTAQRARILKAIDDELSPLDAQEDTEQDFDD
jgi:hypothetical protein